MHGVGANGARRSDEFYLVQLRCRTGQGLQRRHHAGRDGAAQVFAVWRHAVENGGSAKGDGNGGPAVQVMCGGGVYDAVSTNLAGIINRQRYAAAGSRTDYQRLHAQILP